MANSTFSGPVRSENGFKVVSKNTSTGAISTSFTLDGSGMQVAPVALADTASITLTAATNAGRTNVFPNTSQNTTVTLPTPSAGLSFRFIYGGAAADATDHIIKTAGNTIFFKGAITHLDTDGNTNASVFSNGSSNSVISLVTPQSYVIDLVGASATVYHVSGFISDAAVPTIADA